MHHTLNPAAAADTPPTDDGYTWPACTHCHRTLWATETGRLACRPCQDKADTQLAALTDLHVRLNTTAALLAVTTRSHSTPNPPAGGPTSGRAHAPLPLRVDALNLAASGGIATRLCAIEDSWRTALGWTHPLTTDGTHIYPAWRANPRIAIGRHIRFLRDNLLWACGSYDSIADDLNEIHRLHTEATHTLAGTPRPTRVPIGPCPVRLNDDTLCGTPLTATTTSRRVHCTRCGTRWDDLDAWRGLRRAQQATTAIEGAAA